MISLQWIKLNLINAFSSAGNCVGCGNGLRMKIKPSQIILKLQCRLYIQLDKYTPSQELSKLIISYIQLKINFHVYFWKHLLVIMWQEKNTILITLFQPINNISFKFFVRMKCWSRINKSKYIIFLCLTQGNMQAATKN